MKLTHVDDIAGLFKTIDKCSGKVLLIGDGLRLDLKSKLSQYFSLAEIFSGGNEIPELSLETENREDLELLMDYLIRR